MRTIELAGVAFDAITQEQAVDRVRSALDRGEGGRILTPNVDILRQADTPGYAAEASLVVADGMPLVWASRLAGTPLPQRVAGASLIWSLAAGLAGDGRSMFLLGGAPARTLPEDQLPAGRPKDQQETPSAGTSAGWSAPRTADRARPGSGADRAVEVLRAEYPGLRVRGHSPAFGFVADVRLFEVVRDLLVAAAPDLVCVGIGHPRQELVISRLRRVLPDAWYLGCGAAINFVAGDRARAPRWMQRGGLEWLHRLASEPGRLADRYLRQDAPYAARLLANAAASRYRGRG